MIGNSHSPSGNRDRHINAARNWLDRAERQFADGQTVMASATLMLAQAELKLTIEAVTSGAAETAPSRRARTGRLLPFTRTVLGAAALAACMVIGLSVGWIISPPPPKDPEPDQGNHQLSQVTEQTLAVPYVMDESSDDVPIVTEQSTPSEEIFIAEAEIPSPAPVYRPRPAYRPVEPVPDEPAVADEPLIPEPSGGTETAGAETPSDPKEIFHPAELALRTIQALTDRIVTEDVE